MFCGMKMAKIKEMKEKNSHGHLWQTLASKVRVGRWKGITTPLWVLVFRTKTIWEQVVLPYIYCIPRFKQGGFKKKPHGVRKIQKILHCFMSCGVFKAGPKLCTLGFIPEVGHLSGFCVEEVDQVPRHVHQGHVVQHVQVVPAQMSTYCTSASSGS